MDCFARPGAVEGLAGGHLENLEARPTDTWPHWLYTLARAHQLEFGANGGGGRRLPYPTGDIQAEFSSMT